VVVIGGGGHGLATAYYLAHRYGVPRVAVVEKGYVGGGNSGRNTQICRSNYFYPESAAFYEHALRLYERLGRELDFNIMLSQRGVLELAHSPEELDGHRRWVNALRMQGIDAELLGRDEVRALAPELALEGRHPVTGALYQARGGIARHDAVVWGFARAASRAGVDIIENCEVTGFALRGGRIESVQTTRGTLKCERVACCVAGHSSQVARMAGLRLPVESIALQAMVTEPVKPMLHTVVMSGAVHVYLSQSDRGEIVIGGGADLFNSFAQRGTLNTLRENAAAAVELLPPLARLRIMRQWAGICDIAPDRSPIVGATPVPNFYISTGWGTGGFKAIPGGGDTLASTVATGTSHPLIEPFSLARFEAGALVDESAAAGVVQ
jgi:sarcosine oxidase subunit beta